MRQAAKAQCGEPEAQCETRYRDIEAAVEARVIAEAQATRADFFSRVYSELQARCKAGSEAAAASRDPHALKRPKPSCDWNSNAPGQSSKPGIQGRG